MGLQRQENDHGRKRQELVRYLILFAIMCAFFFLVPYTDDDLRWGSEIGAKRLANGFADYGGRYLGYLLVMAMTRSVICKVLVMSGIFTGLVYVVSYISNWKYAIYLTVLLVLLAPLELFSSTMAWVSGYANYVTSIFFTLLFLSCVAQNAYTGGKTLEGRHRRARSLLLFLLGIVNALIVEHFTIYNILLALVVVWYFFKITKRLVPHLFSYFCGCVFGGVLMFSNSAYHNILAGSDSYRKIDFYSMTLNAVKGFSLICRYGYMYNTYLNLAFLAVLCGLCHQHSGRLSPRRRTIVTACLVADACFLVFSFFQIWKYSVVAAMGISIISALAKLTILFVLAQLDRVYLNALFLMVSIAVLDAPFLVVRPLTPRVFFGTYVMFILLLCLLGRQLQIAWPLSGKQVKALLIGSISACLVFFFWIYAHISIWDAQRLADIRMQVETGQQIVEMKSLPREYEAFVHDITLYESWELDGYKAFYGLPKSLILQATKIN